MKIDLPKKEIGEFILKKRRQNGLSQRKLAQAVSCNIQTISNIERGMCIPRNGLFKEILIVLEFTNSEISKIGEMLHKSVDKVLAEEIIP